jgi:hypothetical protein
MIAAGVNAKALAEYMGHSSITVTFDRYGHLMPGNQGEAAAMLDAYLGTDGRSLAFASRNEGRHPTDDSAFCSNCKRRRLSD